MRVRLVVCGSLELHVQLQRSCVSLAACRIKTRGEHAHARELIRERVHQRIRERVHISQQVWPLDP